MSSVVRPRASRVGPLARLQPRPLPRLLPRLLLLGIALLASLGGCLRPRGEAALAASLDAPVARAAERAAATPVAVGDRVRLRVWREPLYSDELSVDADGQIVLPRVGPMTVTGLTIGSLQDSVRLRLQSYLREPVVQVTVLRRVGLQGEVRAPGLYYVDPTMTLRDVIAQAGGLTEAASASRVAVVRGGREYALGDARSQASAADLQSGDAIIVGRRSWLSRNALPVVSTLGLVVSVAVQVFR